MNKKIFLVIVSTLLLGGVFVFIKINKKAPLTQKIESVKIFSENDFFEKHKNSIDFKKYDDYIEKAISIKGSVKDIKENNNKHTLILGIKNKKVNIVCKMQKDQIHKLDHLSIGQNITIKGIYKGYLIDLILLNCIII